MTFITMSYCQKVIFILVTLSSLLSNGSKASDQPPSQACNMLIAIDERLFDFHNRNLNNLTVIVKDMIKGLNDIYQR